MEFKSSHLCDGEDTNLLTLELLASKIHTPTEVPYLLKPGFLRDKTMDDQLHKSPMIINKKSICRLKLLVIKFGQKI